MIQNSRSPVVKSRISSSSGSTMSVENRNLACTGTTSSLLYLTTRAPPAARDEHGRTAPSSAVNSNKGTPYRWAIGEESGDIVLLLCCEPEFARDLDLQTSGRRTEQTAQA